MRAMNVCWAPEGLDLMAFKNGHLRYFVTVAQEGQITKAAARLHLAQPALSQAIAHLEDELGFKLFHRHARGVTLTGDGESFLPKARAALEGQDELERTARVLARAEAGALGVGFVGPPPMISAPELFAAFNAHYPEAQLHFRDLPFPAGATCDWMRDVDVAVCHVAAADAHVGAQVVRVEPRAVLAHRDSLPCQAEQLTLARALDATFIPFAPEVQQAWAAFHSLDDHRRAPPRSVAVDHAATPLQMFSIVTARAAITIAPLCDARVATLAMPGLEAIALADADPAQIAVLWHSDHTHPLAQRLVEISQSLPASEL